MRAPGAVPHVPSFEFKMDDNSAQKNFLIVEGPRLDLSRALCVQEGSSLDYRLEFKPVKVLERLFGLHPNEQDEKDIG